LVESGRFEIEFTTKNRRLLKPVWITFKAKDAIHTTLSTVGKARISEYPLWSEQPAALVLRALHLWRMTYFSSIPHALGNGVVRTMDVTIQHQHDDDDRGLELMALSFIRRSELDGICAVNQTAPGRAYWPMSIDDFHAVPFAVALKVVAQVRHADFNLHELPSPLSVCPHTDNEGNRYVLRDEIPYYALPALDRFNRQYHQDDSPVQAEHIVPARRWDDFLKTI